VLLLYLAMNLNEQAFLQVDTYDDGTINLALNNRNVPELRMSRDFTEMVEEHTKNRANQSKESKEAMMFLKQKMDAAQGDAGDG